MANDKRRKVEPEAAPWYIEGLHFECQEDCGRCCTNHGDYAYVYVEKPDIVQLVEFFGIPRKEFLARYTTKVDGFVVLRMDEPACPFLEGSRCTVYEARPVQCRTFPFWEEHLRSPKTWDETEEFCPGVNRGKRHKFERIRRALNERVR